MGVKLSGSPTYTVHEQLSISSESVLLRATRTSDGKPVILKQLTGIYAPHRALYRLQREHDIGAAIRSSRIARPLAIETFENAPVLVMEDAGGVSLAHHLRTMGPLPVASFLPLVEKLTQTLGEVHDAGVIHKDIKPSNIVYIEPAADVMIIDFGIASISPNEQRALDAGFEGTLAYTSPEQTGRMNRGVDHRTDYYALGVTFYEMLSGELPFTASDPIEWVHCHIALQPRPLHKLRPSVPECLSRVVTKLLAKVAEDRYQTARGILEDLRHCARQLAATGSSAPFELGRSDHADRLHLPQKLYGRDEDIGWLVRVFDSMIDTGQGSLVLIGGYSGVGKSALVHELLKPIVREKAFFISGKFDQYKRDVPYATIVQAFDYLVAQLLASSKERIGAWRKKILDAVGENGALVIELIPQLEHLIGKQPPVPPLSTSEAQVRFNRVFHAFLGVFSTRENPIVIFLDDLQWSDAGSLNLLQYILTQPLNRHFLFVCAYRDNEVSVSHPFMLTVEEIRKGGCMIGTLALKPLSVQHMTEFVTDAFHRSVEDGRTLAHLLHEKTGGNPFFMIQFVSMLHQNGLLHTAERHSDRWTWDIDRIRAQKFTDNVVVLMTSKLQRFSHETQTMLQWMACIGNRVDSDVLCLVAQRAQNDVDRALADALRGGLVVQTDETYRFLHDRVQQAAYALSDEAERPATHLRLGRLLLDGMPKADLDERVFDIVNQFNRGAHLIEDGAERVRIAQLNLSAGRRAMASAAYASAASYFRAGVALLPDDAWDSHYALTFPLHQLQAECAYLTGQHERARELFDILLPRAKTAEDHARTYLTKIDFHTTRGEMQLSIDTGLAGLAHLGIQIPAHPSEAEVKAEFDRLFQQLAMLPKGIDSLLDLRENQNPEIRAAMSIIGVMGPPSMFIGLGLCGLLSARLANYSIEHGHTESIGYGYGMLGLVLHAFEKIEAGCGFGRVALEYVERHDVVSFRGKAGLLYTHVLAIWERHIRRGIETSPSPFDQAIRAGDLAFACYACNQISIARMVSGDHLDDLLAEVSHRLEFVRACKFSEVEDTLVSMQQFVANLQGRTASTSSFASEDFDAVAFEEALKEKSLYPNAWYYTPKLTALVLHGHFEEAAIAAKRACSALGAVIGQIQTAEIYFYDAIATAARATKATGTARDEMLATIRDAEQRYELWAKHCPANFENRLALIQAELARLGGDSVRALQRFDRAIVSAKEHKFIQNAALAAERAAAYLEEMGVPTVARSYRLSAVADYQAWGASRKVAALLAAHPELKQPASRHITSSHPHESTRSTRSFTTAASLDSLTVAKASHAIAREIDIGRLLPVLAQIMLENAGAQRTVVVVRDHERLTIKASIDAAEGEVKVGLSRPVDDEKDVPASIINYVARTGEGVILGDATSSRFENDPYIVRARPKSLMCVPMAYQGRLVGVIYLESHVATEIFDAARLDMMQMLAPQAAIAIENAQLYDEIKGKSRELQQANDKLESEVAERTTELRKTVAELWSEMDLARKIQTVLLPSRVELPGYEGAARMLPASTVGGDYYDVIRSQGCDWLLVGDVSGHGVTAGLIMMMVQTAVRTAIQYATQTQIPLHPSQLLSMVNAAIQTNLSRIGKEQYMTVTALCVRGGIIEYAGLHLDILIYRAATRRVEFIETNGVWLGVFESTENFMTDATLLMEEGDIVLLYTDGVTEARSPDGRLMTTNGLVCTFGDIAASGAMPQQIVDRLFSMLQSFEVDDDVTIVALKRESGASTV